jgi:hypothetical protein
VTVGQAYVLAARQFDRHSSYVALTRHMSRVSLHFGRDEFRDETRLAAWLGRARERDRPLDEATLARPEIDRSALQRGIEALTEKVRGLNRGADRSRGS